MKLLNVAIIGLGVFALTSCGVADRHDEISELNRETKWDEDQTNQAIDIYIEGLNDYAEMYEDIQNIQSKFGLEYSIERYGDSDVKKERKDERKDAEKSLEKLNEEIEKEYKVKSPKYADSYGDESEGYDEYDY